MWQREIRAHETTEKIDAKPKMNNLIGKFRISLPPLWCLLVFLKELNKAMKNGAFFQDNFL